MIMDMERLVIELERRGVVPMKDAVGTRIDCLRGQIWITEHGSREDQVLEAGESYVISRDGLAVMQAFRDALVGIRAPAVRPAGLVTWVGQLCSRAARARPASDSYAAGGALT